jgi:hypothetical protein
LRRASTETGSAFDFQISRALVAQEPVSSPGEGNGPGLYRKGIVRNSAEPARADVIDWFFYPPDTKTTARFGVGPLNKRAQIALALN